MVTVSFEPSNWEIRQHVNRIRWLTGQDPLSNLQNELLAPPLMSNIPLPILGNPLVTNDNNTELQSKPATSVRFVFIEYSIGSKPGEDRS